MASCIICGTETDGPVCDSHEEDVVFAFEGDDPEQLVPGRYYRGTVDGYADFGVFVDLAPDVTGLLHRSELDRRLESLDWEPGDEVFVQVKSVRDNGDIDLAWSIRQADREFRGSLVQEGTEDRKAEAEGPSAPSETSTVTHRPTPEESASGSDGGETATRGGAAASSPDVASDNEAESEPTGDRARVAIGSLEDRVGERVRIEGEVVGARQTGGPTVFELRDETGVIDCAAFVEAGVRAYPEIEVGDIVRLDGTVELRRNELQVETDALAALDGEERETVQRRLAEALTAEARPDDVSPLVDHPAVTGLSDALLDAAETIRRAVLESQPVIVRHAATADGYVAGAALERAVLPLIREEHVESDAVYHYFERRPLESTVYDMDSATKDATRMLQNRDRHGEKLPLVILLGAGSTRESADGLGLLGVYGAERAVIDANVADPEIADEADVLVAPETDAAGTPGTVEPLSAGALAANLAAVVNEDVRPDLRHLPAVSYATETPRPYADLAADAGVDSEQTSRIREAVALEAYYQSYEDKRELVTDLLFGGESSLTDHVSSQYRERLSAEIETALENIDQREENGVPVTLLDTDAYTHQYDFPPTTLLVDELHRREAGDTPRVTIALGTDELFVRTTDEIDLRTVADEVATQVPDAGVRAYGVREGRIEFLSGRRDVVADATVSVVADRLA